MEQHRRALGIAHIIYSLMILVPAALVYILLNTLGYYIDDPDAQKLLPLIGTIVGIVLAVLAIPGLIAGFCVLSNKSWAVTFAMIIGILNILCVPFGTALAAYSIWVFVRENDLKKAAKE